LRTCFLWVKPFIKQEKGVHTDCFNFMAKYEYI
jgi:hypothetical protein